MTNPQTTQKTDHLVTLISGMFLVAVLIAAAGFMGFNPVPATETAAQNVALQNQTASFTFKPQSASVPPLPPLTASLDSSVTQVRVNTPFNLSWEVNNADTNTEVTTFSPNSTFWESLGTLGTLSGSTISGSRQLTESSPGTYEYGISATDGSDTVEAIATVDVILVPNYNSGFNPSDTVDLDGEPGSTASVDLEISSEDGFSGEVEIGLAGVSPSITTPDGDLIDFEFSSATVDVPANGSATASIDMETLLPIRDDQDYDVTVRMSDTSGNATVADKTDVFTINADAFAPRSIEEF